MTTATLTDASTVTLAFPLAAVEGLRHAITLAIHDRPTSERDMLASIYGALVNPQPPRAASRPEAERRGGMRSLRDVAGREGRPAPVDVLAALDAISTELQRRATTNKRAGNFAGERTLRSSVANVEKARAAIAELIEAAREGSATLGHIYHTTPLPPDLEQYAHDGYQRLDAALARVGGGK